MLSKRVPIIYNGTVYPDKQVQIYSMENLGIWFVDFMELARKIAQLQTELPLFAGVKNQKVTEEAVVLSSF